MTKPVLFRKVDVQRAIEAARAAGLDVVSVEFRKDGTINVVTGLTKRRDQSVNEWDHS